MRGNEFLDKLEFIDPALIEAADEPPKRRQAARLKWGRLAACLCIVAVSVYALTAPRQEPPEPTPNPVPAVTAPDPTSNSDRTWAPTSDTYASLEELLDYLRTHDDHSQLDSESRKGGYSAAHAAMEGTDTVSFQGTVYQLASDKGVGIYQNGILAGAIGIPADYLFVSDGRLVVVGTEPDSADELDPVYHVRASIFDLADPANPQKLDAFTQFGGLTACWMAGSQLYLLTDDGVCACGWSRLENVEDYKPQLLHGEEHIPWPEEDISILGAPSRVSYVAATRIDTENLEVLGKHAYYGDIEDLFYGQDWLALITQTTTEHSRTLQDVYTFGDSLNFTGKVDMAAVFGLEKTLTWPEDPPREFQCPEVKAVDYAEGIWHMVGQYHHNIGPTWYRELFAITYEPEGGKPTMKILQLPEEQFMIDDVVWEADRAIISAGFIRFDPYETGTRLAFVKFDGTEITLLSSDLLCDRVTGIDMMYEYGSPLGEIRPFIDLGDGLYLRYTGMPDSFDLYDLSNCNAPKCLYQSQGAITGLPEGGRLDFDNRVLDGSTVAVKLITPGPDGHYFQGAAEYWILIDVRPNEEITITLEESPRYPVIGVDPAAL